MSRGGLFGAIVLLLTVSAIQGCSLSEIPDSSLQNRSDPVEADSGRAFRFDSSSNVHVGSASWYGPGSGKTAGGKCSIKRS
jgi:rare lipoprotein A (peptidoglycan hydrolase)